jgi:prophage DNA circulation protein
VVSFLETLRELKYTAPSGAVFTPLWDELERSRGKKVATHEIPQANFADVQDNGNEAQRFPMAFYYTGKDYQIPADKFFDALGERGPGVLAHPRWGDLRVLATSVSQTEGFVDNMGASFIKVEFVHAPEAEALVVSSSTDAAIQSAADAMSAAAALEAGAQMVASDAAKAAKMKRTALANVKAAQAKLAAVASPLDETRRQIEALGDSIERGIDTLLAAPYSLAISSIQLVRYPARAALGVKAKVDGYAALIGSAIGYIVDAMAHGEAAAVALNLLGLGLATAEAVTVGDIVSRAEAIAARDAMNAAVLEAEAGIQAVEAYGYITDPVTLAALAELRTNASAYLLEKSYTLPTERIKTLEGDSTAINLAWELLGDPERMDEIIDLNGFGGMIVIPRGTEVRYYA